MLKISLNMETPVRFSISLLVCLAFLMSAVLSCSSGAGFFRPGYAYGTPENKKPSEPGPEVGQASDPLNAVYTIEGSEVHLQDGYSEEEIVSGSAVKLKTFVIGMPVSGDLDADGDPDEVLLLGQDPGGSGTFYYIAAALYRKGKYHGTNGILLGDRIIFQNGVISNGTIIVSYKKRRPTEAMVIEPSVDVEVHIAFNGGRLEVIKLPD